MRASAVILAAGEASRAGGPKTVWPVEGLPSVRRVALASLGADMVAETAVVCGGPWASEVEKALEGLNLKLIFNPDSGRGQSGSLRLGLGGLKPDSPAVIFLLADQPFITSQIIDDLLIFHQNSGSSLAAPFFQGRRRNPAVFSLSLWREELMNLSGDQGGKAILTGHPGQLALWPCDHLFEKCFLDFDTWEEYENLIHEQQPGK